MYNLSSWHLFGLLRNERPVDGMGDKLMGIGFACFVNSILI